MPGSGIVIVSVAVPFLRFLFSLPIVKWLRALTRIVSGTRRRPPHGVRDGHLHRIAARRRVDVGDGVAGGLAAVAEVEARLADRPDVGGRGRELHRVGDRRRARDRDLAQLRRVGVVAGPLDDVVGAVVAHPDHRRVATRVHRRPRVEEVRAALRDRDRGPEGARARRAHRRPDDLVGAVFPGPDDDRVALVADARLRGNSGSSFPLLMFTRWREGAARGPRRRLQEASVAPRGARRRWRLRWGPHRAPGVPQSHPRARRPRAARRRRPAP